MATLNPQRTRHYLEEFDFQELFVEELGWSHPASRRKESVSANGIDFSLRPIAQLGGVVVLEVVAADGQVPDVRTRAALHREVSKSYHENLLIFRDEDNTQTVWYWMKREGNKQHPRSHIYVKGQPGDLFLSKLARLQFELGEFDERGDVGVLKVVSRLKDALDVERVTRRFFNEFQRLHTEFLALIEGIPDDRDCRWYASVILNRLMFIYFMQGKGFLDSGNYNYLQDRLDLSKQRFGENRYFRDFLRPLFFEGFAREEHERDSQTRALLGQIPYLSGSLFIPHRIEEAYQIQIPDTAFENLFALFKRFTWNLNDVPGEDDNEINPDVLGYIFEKYINQKAFGAYYTRTEITEYLCEQTINRLIVDQIQEKTGRHFDSVKELLVSLDAVLCRSLLNEILPTLSLLDPACGSGAFLVAALKTLINVYSAVTGRIPYLGDYKLNNWLRDVRREHPSEAYFIKKKIITENLFGVDLMEEAVEIAKVRLFLTLVASVEKVDQLEPLPNIDFNILPGNSLIGLLSLKQTQHAGGQLDLLFHDALAEKNRKIKRFRDTTGELRGVSLQTLRDEIDALREEANPTLDGIALKQFQGLGIQYEQVTWDIRKNQPGQSKKRRLTLSDIEERRPFHWGYEFSEIMNERGGFDAIITNPPWDIFKPNSREFFAQHAEDITINRMSREEFDARQQQLLQDGTLRQAWERYLSSFPFMSSYFRSASQYESQTSTANGRMVGSDLNLFKLFLEQCYNLLRVGGQCGIVIPSGIYTDLGAKGLRELLFAKTRITGLFGFENRREIFEGVHRSYKFVVLTFRKGGSTQVFPATFMRLDVTDLAKFPQEIGVELTVDMVKELSPDSLSIMEFNDPADVVIARKMTRFPLLREEIEGVWNLSLSTDFHMTNDRDLFRTAPGAGRLPLYEGKMVHQFNAYFAGPRYWVDEHEGRQRLIKRGDVDNGQVLDYQQYRFGIRAIGRNTDSRTMIVGPIPGGVFCGNSLLVCQRDSLTADSSVLVVQSILNSLVVDYMLRFSVTANVNMFYIYQIPVPRLMAGDRFFDAIVERAAKLVCITQEFDDLARAAGLSGYEEGVTDEAERARLRAELDGMVAHLYGLTEEEFQHILVTFPLVDPSTKQAALEAYRALAPLPGHQEVAL